MHCPQPGCVGEDCSLASGLCNLPSLPQDVQSNTGLLVSTRPLVEEARSISLQKGPRAPTSGPFGSFPGPRVRIPGPLIPSSRPPSTIGWPQLVSRMSCANKQTKAGLYSLPSLPQDVQSTHHSSSGSPQPRTQADHRAHQRLDIAPSVPPPLLSPASLLHLRP